MMVLLGPRKPRGHYTGIAVTRTPMISARARKANEMVDEFLAMISERWNRSSREEINRSRVMTGGRRGHHSMHANEKRPK